MSKVNTILKAMAWSAVVILAILTLRVALGAATAERWFKLDGLVTSVVPTETDLGLEIEVEYRRVICPPELAFMCKILRSGDVVDVEGPDTPIDVDIQDVRHLDRLCVNRAAQVLPPPDPERTFR